jgi:RecA-family ATPase
MKKSDLSIINLQQFNGNIELTVIGGSSIVMDITNADAEAIDLLHAAMDNKSKFIAIKFENDRERIVNKKNIVAMNITKNNNKC